SLEINGISEKQVRGKTQTTITIRRLQPQLWSQRDEEFQAIARDGKVIHPVGSSGRPDGVSEYDFPVTKDQIVSVIFRYRPFEVREIRNVSLRPNTKTTPTVVGATTR